MQIHLTSIRERKAHLAHLDTLFVELRDHILQRRGEALRSSSEWAVGSEEVRQEEPDTANLCVEEEDCCFSCGELLKASLEEGKVIFALGKKWHPRHFKCAFCAARIESKEVIPTDRASVDQY